MNRARFAFEARDPLPSGEDGEPSGVHVGNVRTVEVYDARQDPHRDYLGSLSMASEQHAALVGELIGAAAARALHVPCHDPAALGSSEEICAAGTPVGTHRDRRGSSHEWRDPRCQECGKTFPCPTAEVLPS